MTLPPSDDATVRSVRRAFSVLRAFGPADRSLPLGEIARRTDLDKATARRLLRTLMGEELVEQVGPNRDYSLALGVLTLVAGANPAAVLRRRAQPLLASLAAATGAVAFLSVLHAGAVLCIEAAGGDWATPPPVSTGARWPLDSCAVARVLLAFQPHDSRLSTLLRPGTGEGGAPHDPAQLAGMLAAIRRRGWETSIDERAQGACMLALPVHGADGQVIAALGIIGPASLIGDGGRPRHLDLVREALRQWEQNSA
jgi:DNA-binding IclR family transcriptional regulator